MGLGWLLLIALIILGGSILIARSKNYKRNNIEEFNEVNEVNEVKADIEELDTNFDLTKDQEKLLIDHIARHLSNYFDIDDVSEIGKYDDLFDDAARLIVSNQLGSTSLIQRRFSIGYNRAGRIMDQLEAAGIVGYNEGIKARQVLFTDVSSLENYLDKIANTPSIHNLSDDFINNFTENHKELIDAKTDYYLSLINENNSKREREAEEEAIRIEKEKIKQKAYNKTIK